MWIWHRFHVSWNTLLGGAGGIFYPTLWKWMCGLVYYQTSVGRIIPSSFSCSLGKMPVLKWAYQIVKCRTQEFSWPEKTPSLFPTPLPNVPGNAKGCPFAGLPLLLLFSLLFFTQYIASFLDSNACSVHIVDVQWGFWLPLLFINLFVHLCKYSLSMC